MSFFKDFKEDLSQAVNELVPGEDTTEAAEQDNDVVVNTLEDELDVESDLSTYAIILLLFVANHLMVLSFQ